MAMPPNRSLAWTGCRGNIGRRWRTAFLSYHVMIGIGMYFIGLTLFASWLLWRGTLFQRRWLLWVFVFSIVPAVAANQLGWVSAEIGRQPWVVHPRFERDADGDFALNDAGMLRYRTEEGLLTKNAVSEVITREQVIGSIVMFGVIYLLLGAIWVRVLHQKISIGPEAKPAGGGTMANFAAVASERVEHDQLLTEPDAKDKPPQDSGGY